MSDLSIGLGGAFGCFAIVLLFEGGDIISISLMLLGLLYVLLGKRMKSKTIGIIAHIIYGIGALFALTLLLDLFAGHQFEFAWQDLVSQLIVIVIIVVGGLVNGDLVKKVYTTYGLLVYGLIMVYGYGYHLAGGDAPKVAIIMFGHCAYILFLFIVLSYQNFCLILVFALLHSYPYLFDCSQWA